MITKQELVVIKPILLGAKFVYRIVEILGPECANSRKPPFEGQILTIVGFMPRYVNDVVVQTIDGIQSLLPLWQVKKALGLPSLPIWTQNSASFPDIRIVSPVLRKSV